MKIDKWSELPRVEMNLERPKLNLIHVPTALKACGLHTENICFCSDYSIKCVSTYIFNAPSWHIVGYESQ